MLAKLKLMAVVLTIAARLTTRTGHEWLMYADKVYFAKLMHVYLLLYIKIYNPSVCQEYSE
jgi:hypothetical protein